MVQVQWQKLIWMENGSKTLLQSYYPYFFLFRTIYIHKFKCLREFYVPLFLYGNDCVESRGCYTIHYTTQSVWYSIKSNNFFVCFTFVDTLNSTKYGAVYNCL